VYVEIANPVCFPGEVVSGFLHVNLVKRIDCTGVYIKVSGKEFVHWSRTEGAGKSKHTRHYYGGQTLFKMLVPIQASSSRNLIGQFSFPFTFQLPAGLPGSYSSRASHSLLTSHIDASISYKIKGVVAVAGVFKSNIRSFADLLLIETPQPVERVMCEAETNVNVCCLINKGVVKMIAFTDKESYQPGETIRLKASIDNKSSSTIRSVIVELHSILEVQAGYACNGLTKRIAQHVYPGLKPGQGFSDEELFVEIPVGIEQQSLGIDVRHSYVVTFRADVSLARDPACRIPVGIHFGERPTQVRAEVIVPQRWSPETMAPTAIALDQHPRVAAPIDLSKFENLAPLPSAYTNKRERF